ncbi:iron-containing alcohol dehydrogenase [Sulfitobacter sp. F26169L]|uniref:iron-containing alcohol dehydrogenase n=1 Tax=Sulfitobacter sp. F26169L TaxID=2996015 RepID=UPI00226103E3|nr:iron-containing alcohol dehydrogenase [Sulfitobacter sp. F26169L]MCX7567972.1 iron-containing alcohol dehydrogenase [Sulfitobacter sp. F26169L]
MTPFTFNTTPSVRFVPDGLNDLAASVGSLLGQRIVIVTDRGLVATGIPDRAVQAMTQAGAQVHLFDSVEADPPEAIIESATQMMRDVDATGVIGLGGGSSLDVAKLAAALAKSGATLADSYGIGNLAGGRLPLVLIPTTAGTGSEVTPISIVTTGENAKMGVVSPVMLPDVALLDPLLTVGLPAHVTAATGIDAMVHAIEAYCSASPNNNPVSRTLACEALRLMGAALETAVAEPDNIAARSDMLLGSLLAGQAFANSPVAAVHALAYPIGGRFKVPHGLSNALVLPHVLRFNIQTAPDAYAQIAPLLFPHLTGAVADVAAAFCDELQALALRCGLPARLRDVDIGKDALGPMADDAMQQTRLLVNNPRPVERADAFAIYEAAW